MGIKSQYIKERTNEIAKSEHLLSSDIIESKRDQDLFIVDTNGDEKAYKRKRCELNSGIDARKKKKIVVKSDVEDKLVKRVVKKLEKKKPTIYKKSFSNKFDLWNDEEQIVSLTKKPKVRLQHMPSAQAGLHSVQIVSKTLAPVSKKRLDKKKKVSIDVALPGQSYKPDNMQHQEAIKQAVDIEIKRSHIQEYLDTPISNGLKPETLDVLLDSDDEEENDDNEGEKEPMEIAQPRKKVEKMTRAQRNKQKRHKQLLTQQLLSKKKKQFLHEITIAPYSLKQLKCQESKHKERRDQLQEYKKEKFDAKQGVDVWKNQDPLQVSSFPVGLESEVKNQSLRSIVPKGTLLFDRTYSMSTRNMLNLKKRKD